MSSSLSKTEPWYELLSLRLPELGHRNWIVVADAAYPAQSNSSIETVATGVDQIELLRATMDAVARASHVRANVYLDRELKYVSEEDAPGVSAYREALCRITNGIAARELDHEKIIAKLDESARLFRVLVLKSTFTLPYTSVFLELDCGYWNAEAESRLRKTLENPSRPLMILSPKADNIPL
jgi:hypothetical protein